MTTLKIADKIEKAHYVIQSDHDVELLAAAHLACDDATKRVSGQYLRILIAQCQAQFDGGKARRKITAPDREAHAAFLQTVHLRLYAHIVKGVTSPDVADATDLKPDDRRARTAIRAGRASFARSAASTLMAYIRAGGDVRILDVTQVTKSGLRTWTRAAMDHATPRADIVQSVAARLEKEARNLMEEDPGGGRLALEDLIERLQAIVDQAGEPAGHTESRVFQGKRGAAFKPRAVPA